MSRPTIFVCQGSSCRRKSACKELRDCLGPVADLAEVRCQRVCDGPVVGTDVNGELEWFMRMDSGKAQRHLVELVAGLGRVRKSLKKRLVPERSGRLR